MKPYNRITLANGTTWQLRDEYSIIAHWRRYLDTIIHNIKNDESNDMYAFDLGVSPDGAKDQIRKWDRVV